VLGLGRERGSALNVVNGQFAGDYVTKATVLETLEVWQWRRIEK
jgi:hypothetical protein